MSWMVRHLESSGFRVEQSAHIPVLYGANYIKGQLNVARRKLPLFADKAVAESMERHRNTLERRATAYINRFGKIRFGSDYVIKASPV